MNLLEFVTSPSIYHGCSNRKIFWKKNFTGEEKFTPGEFTPVNMKNCGRRNVRKHKDIKDSDKYITLDILLKFISLDKILITSSNPKYHLGRLGEGLITSMGIKANERSKKYKKSRYAIGNISMKNLSKIIR